MKIVRILVETHVLNIHEKINSKLKILEEKKSYYATDPATKPKLDFPIINCQFNFTKIYL